MNAFVSCLCSSAFTFLSPPAVSTLESFSACFINTLCTLQYSVIHLHCFHFIFFHFPLSFPSSFSSYTLLYAYNTTYMQCKSPAFEIALLPKYRSAHDHRTEHRCVRTSTVTVKVLTQQIIESRIF